MNTPPLSKARVLWSRILVTVGSIAILVGALDPLEGSLLILPGSGLVALGTFLGQGERRLVAYRVWVFILIALGVGAMWGLTSVGGFGGKSGRSMWWGMLLLPYLVGWVMAIWGPGFPRWFRLLGIGVGLWYLTILTIVVAHAGLQQAGAALVVGALGVVTIAGGAYRLAFRTAVPQ
jgi:hypothetical protein